MFINFGDKNFLEYGVLVDAERVEKTDIHILYCRPYDDEEDLYYFADCNIDITDNWIDVQKVKEFYGIKNAIDENNMIDFAIACIEYYGAYNFTDNYNIMQLTADEVREKLSNYLIAWDNLVVEN